MNKNIVLVTLVVLFLPVVALAGLKSYGPSYSITGMVSSLEMAAGLIFGAVAVICFVMAGILFLTSKGEPEKLKAAKSAVIWGVAGVIVGILAFSIIAIVSNMLS
jgi:uncharacterized membrane protein (DUF485 family)